MSKPILISHHLCPYVQRAVIAFTEKGIDFDKCLIDLGNKPDWFLAVSPTGKVPVLQTEKGVIFESAVILEYIEDTSSAPLHPQDPFERARHRAWMDVGSTILGGIARLYSAANKTAFELAATALRRQFEQVEQALSDSKYFGGQYFGGDQFSMVDSVYGPVFRYFYTFDLIGDFGILTDFPKITAWRTALAKRPSVQHAVAVEYPQKLRHFLKQKDSYISGLISAKPTAEAAA